MIHREAGPQQQGYVSHKKNFKGAFLLTSYGRYAPKNGSYLHEYTTPLTANCARAVVL